MTAPPRLFLSVHGQPVRAVLDTGSVGVAIAAASVPGWQSLSVLGPARLGYSSSGRILDGVWVSTRITVTGRDGAAVTTEPMPVMIVTTVTCAPNARNCVSDVHPHHVAMLGIGFARGENATPDHNPFLRLLGANRPGYMLTAAGVTVGLANPARYAGFRTVQLHRAPGAIDWSAPPACISVAAHQPPACGTLLVDTGVTRSFLTVPPTQLVGVIDKERGVPAIRPGTSVTVGLPGGTEPWGYTFHVDDGADPASPAGVTLVGGAGRPLFINTSLHILNRFDYLYDAGQGLVGFRPRD